VPPTSRSIAFFLFRDTLELQGDILGQMFFFVKNLCDPFPCGTQGDLPVTWWKRRTSEVAIDGTGTASETTELQVLQGGLTLGAGGGKDSTSLVLVLTAADPAQIGQVWVSDMTDDSWSLYPYKQGAELTSSGMSSFLHVVGRSLRMT
jgi:hypothetical protein